MTAARACLSSVRFLFWFDALKGVPLLAAKLNDRVPTPHTEERNAVEHSKRSAELYGWAVVDNQIEAGEQDNRDAHQLRLTPNGLRKFFRKVKPRL